MGADLPTIAFKTPRDWELWLAKHHKISKGIWMKLYKKASGQKSVTYAEALEAALCYGWIDGQKDRFDEKAWLQRFTPRRRQSVWSAKNTALAERLIKAGRMKASGLAEVEAAKQEGRWKRAYLSQSKAVLPDDFLEKVRGNKKAAAFLATLNRANVYAIIYRLNSAKKPETREKRMAQYLDMLIKGEKLHP